MEWKNDTAKFFLFRPLQHPFRAGQVITKRISLHRHADGLGKSLENSLYLMMFIVPPAFDVQVAAGGIGK